MEAIIEEISYVFDKIDIIKLYSVGGKIHHVINQCNQNCASLQYLTDLKNLIDTINTNDVPANQKIIFEEVKLKNSNSFLLYDQINKKFGSEIFIMNENILIIAVNFEVKKVFETNRNNGEIRRVDLYFFKKFYLIFFRKKKPKNGFKYVNC